jgi:hypothetical protein
LFASALTDGSDSLDRLNQQFGVSAGHEVFVARHGVSTAAATATYMDGLTATKERFPERTRRIPADAPPPPSLVNVYALDLAAGSDPLEVCRLYNADPHVEYCQPNFVMELTGFPTDPPNDPFFHSSGSWGQPYADLWGLAAIKAPAVRTSWSPWSTRVLTSTIPTWPPMCGRTLPTR